MMGMNQEHGKINWRINSIRWLIWNII